MMLSASSSSCHAARSRTATAPRRAAPTPAIAARRRRAVRVASAENDADQTTTTTTPPPPADPITTTTTTTTPTAPPKRRRQADSTDAVASFLTRRFGIFGGLAWLGVLTFGVVSEQVKTRRELAEEEKGTRDVSSVAERTLPSGVAYRELRVGGGARPQRGDLVVLEFTARFSSPDGGAAFSDPPFLDTKLKKPVVLVWGARPLPLAAGICEGLADAIADGMRAGGRRVVTVPAASGFGASPPPGVPQGAALQYDLTLSRVSVAPS